MSIISFSESMRPISVVISSQVTMETTDMPILRKFPVILEFEIFEEMVIIIFRNL